MMNEYPVYYDYQFLPHPEMMSLAAYQMNSHSQKSSKKSSRKRSTDIDSMTKFKTQVCKYWKNNMLCPFGDNCNFAHGGQEIRYRDFLPSKYKTRQCNKFNEDGYCPYGQRCQFIHSQYKKPRVLHGQILNCLGFQAQKFFAFIEEKQKNSGKCQRLSVFETLCLENEDGIHKTDEIYKINILDEYQNYVDVRSRHNSF